MTNNTYSGTIIKTAQDNSISHDAGFYFDIITEHSVNIENNITDNYLENNTAIQDTIAHAPITMTLTGIAAELVYVPSTNNGRFLNQFYKILNTKDNITRDYITTDKLSAIGQLLPPVDNLTQLAKNTIVYIEDSADRYIKIFKNIKRNMNDKTRLQEVYTKLMVLRENNTEMVATTPFGTFEKMYIQNIQFNQGNENHTANISISLKQLNFTDIEVTNPDLNVLAKYNAAAQAETENNGKADGVFSSNSNLYDIFGKPFNLKYRNFNT